MILTHQHIAFIEDDIRTRGIHMDDLAENILDHICCSIENDCATNFDEAYQKAIASFGPNGFERTQQQTTFLITLKRKTIMIKTMHILGYLAALLGSMGLLFKVLYWPGANVMITVGILLLNLGFLPLYFIDRYKRAVSK